MSSTAADASTASLARATKMWETYCQVWSATNPQRQQLLERCLTPSFHMFNDRGDTSGYEAIQKIVDGFQARTPGATFSTKAVQAHNSFAKMEWDCMDASGKVVMSGVDFVDLAEDGRAKRIVAFDA